uniref:Uncharacterized protein n=1 Tax=Eptatretus burgeri TaxID=7764 RepID=A0A8C4Q3Q9_EPTBU
MIGYLFCFFHYFLFQKCDVLMMSQFADMFQILLSAFPSWSAKDMAEYYISILFYKQGCDHDNDGWDLLKKAVKISVADVTDCPGKSEQKEVYIKLLSCFITLFEFELFFINTRNTKESSEPTTFGPFVLAKLFCTNSGVAPLTWSGIEWLGQQLVEQFRTTQDNVMVHSFVNIKSMKRKTFIQQVSSIDRKLGLLEESSTPKNGKADELADHPCCSLNRKGETKLHVACINNDIKGLSQLLSIPGIDINIQDNAGWTPLHEACLHGHRACVEAILNMHPNVNLMIDVKGVTPIHDAVTNGHWGIVEVLVRHAGPTFLQVHLNNNVTVLDLLKSHFPQEKLVKLMQDVEHATDRLCVKGNAHGGDGAVFETACSRDIKQTRDRKLMSVISQPFSCSCADDQEVYCLLVFLTLNNYIWVNRLHQLTLLAVADGGETKDKQSMLMQLSCHAVGPISSYLEDLRTLIELPQHVTLLKHSLEKSFYPHPLSKRTQVLLNNILIISSRVSKPQHGKYLTRDEH